MVNTNETGSDEQTNAKELTIIVNGREKVITAKELSFSDLIKLAFENPLTGPNVIYTITYRRGNGDKPDGTLVEGQSIKLKDGMIFNVSQTDKS